MAAISLLDQVSDLDDPACVAGLSRDGIPVWLIESAASTYDVSVADLATAAHIPERTLARRKREGKLSPEESDRLLRLIRVLAEAARTLGDPTNAGRWVRQPNRALSGSSPLSLLDTDSGAIAVTRVLGRIAHGIPS